MSRISFRSVLLTHAFFVGLLVFGVPFSCTADTRLSYHLIAAPDDAIPQVAEMCSSGEQSQFRYRFPAGKVVDLTASTSPAFSVQLDPDIAVRLIKAPSVGEAPAIVNAEMVPDPGLVADAATHRRRFQWCDLLIIANGNPVGIAHAGTGPWGSSLPGVTFSSYESAEAVYSVVGDRVERAVSSSADVDRDTEIAAWIKHRDAWVFHCHPEAKAAIKAGDPVAYERLIALPRPDCRKQPAPPVSVQPSHAAGHGN